MADREPMAVTIANEPDGERYVVLLDGEHGEYRDLVPEDRRDAFSL